MISIIVAVTRPSAIGAWLLVLCTWSLSLPAAARELHWRELAVTARLDAAGHLHVSELHQMVFTGDYNGGERRFRVLGGQRFQLESITRVEEDGREVQLAEGDLSGSDQFAWHETHLLRWRSRQPDDPPFDRTPLTYRLDYELEGVLVDEGGGAYTLDHDFAFPDRPGVIERFRLHFEADPAWSTPRGLPLELAREGLRPSESVVVALPLEHRGGASSRVSASERSRLVGSLPVRLGLAAALVCAVLLLVGVARSRERELGRFDDAPSAPASAAWLRQHVFVFRPELVGALYHERVGPTEVAALLARLELEGKIQNLGAQPADGLRLRLLVERGAFSGYERQLIDKLFVSGHETTTKRLRQHYAAVGFYPPALLSDSVGREMTALLGQGEGGALLGCLLVPGVFFSAACLFIVFCVLVASQPAVEPSWLLSAVVFGGLAFAVLGLRFARRARLAERGVGAAHDQLALWLVAGALGTAFLLVAARTLPLSALLVLTALAFCLVLLPLWMSRTASSREGVALRRRLRLARQQLLELLERGERNEAWLPYLVALDLGDGLESLFRGVAAPAGTPPRHGSRSDAVSSSSTSDPPASGWSGGGGSFGGAGASFAWGAAVSELAQGVAGPSTGSSSAPSSSSSGSSSDGGGSSGGGGGGGW